MPYLLGKITPFMDDFFSDNGFLFAKVLGSYELPTYVQDGDTGSEKKASLEDECFADPVVRRFPIHSRAHTFVSAAYLAKQASREEAPDLYDAIDKRASIYGISDDIKAVREYVGREFTNNVKVAESAGVPFEVEFGTLTVGKVAGCGKEAADRSISRFLEVVGEIPFQNLKPAAEALIKAAEDNGTQAPAELRKFAGIGVAAEPEIQEQRDLRLGLIPDPISKKAACESLKSIKTAEALHSFDQEHQLEPYYGERLERPHGVFFTGASENTKTAAEISTQVLLDRFVKEGEAGDVYRALVEVVGQEKTASFLADRTLTLEGAQAKLLATYLKGCH